jgi:hypothetical protein
MVPAPRQLLRGPDVARQPAKNSSATVRPKRSRGSCQRTGSSCAEQDPGSVIGERRPRRGCFMGVM